MDIRPHLDFDARRGTGPRPTVNPKILKIRDSDNAIDIKDLANLKKLLRRYPPKSGKIYGTITFWTTVNVPKIE